MVAISLFNISSKLSEKKTVIEIIYNYSVLANLPFVFHIVFSIDGYGSCQTIQISSETSINPKDHA